MLVIEDHAAHPLFFFFRSPAPRQDVQLKCVEQSRGTLAVLLVCRRPDRGVTVDRGDVLDVGVDHVGWEAPTETEKALQIRITCERHRHAIERGLGQAQELVAPQRNGRAGVLLASIHAHRHREMVGIFAEFEVDVPNSAKTLAPIIR